MLRTSSHLKPTPALGTHGAQDHDRKNFSHKKRNDLMASKRVMPPVPRHRLERSPKIERNYHQRDELKVRVLRSKKHSVNLQRERGQNCGQSAHD